MDIALWVEIVVFFIFMWLLYRLFKRPIGNMLQQRAERIEEGQRAAAESERRAAEIQREVQRQLDEAHAEAQSIIAAASRAADAQSQALAAQASAEVEAFVRRTEAAIQRERQVAVEELRREAGRLTVIAAGRVVGHSLSQDIEVRRELADRAIADVDRRG